MQNEIVFTADQSNLNPKHVGMILGGFFIFMQLFFLEGAAVRIWFGLAFAVFAILGLRLLRRHSQSWPQEITVNATGISDSQMQQRHGVNGIPWQEIEQMDLFYSAPKLPPHLRIALKSGALKKRVNRHAARAGAGFDVNVPVAVNVPAEDVLATAKRFWRATR